MASITDIQPPRPTEGPGLYFGPVPDDRRRAALAMLLSGAPHPGDPSVDQFEQFARQQGLDTRGLWMAGDGGPDGPLMGSILLVPNPGATAVLFVGPARGWADHGVMAKLVAHATDDPRYAGVRVVQSLLDPGQVLEGKMLERAGLFKLAKLVYMQKTVDRREFATPRPTKLGRTDVTVHTYGPDQHDRFAKAILASYIDTLDCPGLVGLRGIDQVIEGHQSTGRFTPNLWHAFYDKDDQPVAVLLLAPSTAGSGFELVYLGVSPGYRGLGVGGQVMSYAVAEVTRRGGDRIFLAVDDRNTAAMRLYRGLGFRASVRKLAYILPRGVAGE